MKDSTINAVSKKVIELENKAKIHRVTDKVKWCENLMKFMLKNNDYLGAMALGYMLTQLSDKADTFSKGW